ncbi:MAG: tetratricopeptide repeat protein [Thermodesulfobacteriota bacterium]
MSVIYKSLQQLQEKERVRTSASTPQAVAPRMRQILVRGGVIIGIFLLLVGSGAYFIKTQIQTITAPPPPDTTVGAARQAAAPPPAPAAAEEIPKEAPKLATPEPLLTQRLHREAPQRQEPLDLTKPTKALETHFASQARKNEELLSLEKKLVQTTNQGDITQSREILSTMASQLGKQESATKFKWDGYLALREKRYTDAENYYRRALSLKPSDFTSNLNLLYALMGQGKTEEAVAIYRKLVERYPMNEKVLAVGSALGQR